MNDHKTPDPFLPAVSPATRAGTINELSAA